MIDQQNVKIHLTIGSITLPLTVPRDREQVYRNAAMMANQYFQGYVNQHPGNSVETYFAMTLFDFAKRLVEVRAIDDDMRRLTNQIDQAMQQHSVPQDGKPHTN